MTEDKQTRAGPVGRKSKKLSFYEVKGHGTGLCPFSGLETPEDVFAGGTTELLTLEYD
jgi:hypothetical protein